MLPPIIVTHHAPDLDAITSVWLLKRFLAQKFANAKIDFVNPGQRITEERLKELNVDRDQVIHTDTGLGEFDHHQPDRAQQYISATSLVFDYLGQIHPELEDDEALRFLVDFVTEIDHFGEIHWPEAGHDRYAFMLHEVIHGLEHLELHDDDSQLHFGMTCLDSCYQTLKNRIKAKQILERKGQKFTLPAGSCLAIETRSDDVIKLAQKQGFVLVARKDSKEGHIRIKARPDSDINLEALYHAIQKIDHTGTWYFHPSGKMLLNGSRKNHDQVASPLSLKEIVTLIEQIYS